MYRRLRTVYSTSYGYHIIIIKIEKIIKNEASTSNR